MILQPDTFKFIRNIGSKSKCILRFVALFLGVIITQSGRSEAAEVTFIKVYKGTGAGYDKNTQSIVLTSALVGTSFKFISKDPADPVFFAGGNDIEGNLQYVNGSGATITIFGTVSRKSSVGSTTQSFYFGALDNAGLYTGEAYELIMNPYMSLFPGNQTVGTNSSSVEKALNDYLLTQSRLFNLSATAGSVSETGTTTTFRIVLASQPSANVVLNISRDDITEASASPASLTFTSVNWNVAQVVTITGLDDVLLDGSQNTIFTVSVNQAATLDDAFDPAPSKTYTATTLDDEGPTNISGPGGAVTPAQTTAAITINENTTSVFNYLASKTVSWSLSGTDSDLFTISNTGVLTFKLAPDYELPLDDGRNNIYNITINALDLSNLTTTQTLTVTVANLDDTKANLTGPGATVAPAASSATISVRENQTAVFSYTSNEVVTWSISGTDNLLFDISVTGVITFKTAPDYEVPGDVGIDNIYNIIVHGLDLSDNETTQTLAITVTNVDEIAPNITGPGPATAPATGNALISLKENTTFVFEYTANEPIASWSVTGTDSGLFTIGSDGKLVFNAAPDFELPGDNGANNVYDIIIEGVDNAGNKTIQSLKITVTNVDEIAPNITGPGPSTAPATGNALISLKENTTFVFEYTANEPIASWSVTGTDSGLFTIGSDGKLVFNAAPDFELPGDNGANNVYDIIIEGVDNAGNKTIQSLKITITNVDEIAPNITGPGPSTAPATGNALISLKENTTFVFEYTANEPIASWSVTGTDSGLFTIGSDGKLVFNAAPDFELPGDNGANNVYDIIIEGVDNAGNKTIQSLKITITNVDEIAPNITGPGPATAPATGNALISLKENTTFVFEYTANEPIASWSVTGTDSGLFTIGSDGKLVFKAAPDFELPADANKDNIYEIVIEGVDNANNKTSQILKVKIIDVDDTPPTLLGPGGATASAAISIIENNTLVFGYSANEPVSWFLSGEDAGLFKIEADGTLLFKIAPDFELPGDADRNNIYLLTIAAKDLDNNSASQNLVITVTNANEAPYNLTLSTAVIYEGNSLNAQIGTLASDDVDAGDRFIYSIVGGDAASFVISGNELKANTVFSYRSKSSYTVTLRSTDAGGLTYDKVIAVSIAKAPTLTGVANFPGNKKSAASGNSVTISKGYSVNLDVTGSNIVSYSWSPGTGLSASNIANPIANPSVTTRYAVTVTNSQGISTVLNITVTVLEDYNVTPTNVISPNGDGVNDGWVIENISSYPNAVVQIFDKAGRLIHKVKNYQNDWTGQLNGGLLHTGAYYYLIDFGPGIQPKAGYITVFTNN